MRRQHLWAIVAMVGGCGLVIGLAGRWPVVAERIGPADAQSPQAPPAAWAGLQGDGVADDTAALQKILSKGGHVVLPAGTYRLTRTIDIDLNQTGFISISGHGVARLVMAGPGPALRFIGTHRGTAQPKTVDAVVWERQRMPCVDGIEIVGVHPEADGIAARGTMQLTIRRVMIRQCRHGIHLYDRNRNVIISDSHIYQNRGVGIYLDDVNLHQINVVGCHISYCDGGGIVVRAGEVRNLQVTGCDIESNQGVNMPPTANILIDSVGGTNAEIAITGCTIQHNHDAGGSANIRIRGPASRKIPDTDEMREGHVVICGNVISDVMVNVHLQHARGVVITGNTFWTAYEYNLLVENSSYVTVGPNNFDRNPRYWREEQPTTANGIYFRDCSECVLQGFVISATRATPAAVRLERCRRFQVSDLSIFDWDGVGLLLQDVSDSRIAGCLIRDDRPRSTSRSVRASGGSGNMIVNNYFGRPYDIPDSCGWLQGNYSPKP